MSEIDLDEASLRDLVMVNDGQVVTTSLKVAERFGKRHDNVLRAIDNLDCSAGFRLLNFEETVMWRENPSGGEPIKSRSFDMTKDGFMFLVMGFRGKAAAAWKEAFIHAFNWMAEQLFKRSMDFNTMRNELMAEYRQERGIASLAGKTLRRWQIRDPSSNRRSSRSSAKGSCSCFTPDPSGTYPDERKPATERASSF
ncbi:Rha family transcriptional regulator [Pseudomonas aeruginosa]|uniref:Rha family transcriptional regulator n=8 Tax=Pseudomonas aeruginosa TaxID=287 RepID=UPI001FC92DEB|nr:Rha family transcriptional regulator [Pseudomonas aeruginosa]